MINILFIGNSFFHRSSRKNFVDAILMAICNVFKITLSIHEGKGIYSFWHDKTIRNKILTKVKSKQYDYILICGGVPNSAWLNSGRLLINEIKKYNKAKICIVACNHTSKPWSQCIAWYKKLSAMVNGKLITVGDFYAPVNKMFPKLKLTDTDNRHPSWVSYYVMAVSIYCALLKKIPPYYIVPPNNTLTNHERAGIVSIVASYYALQEPKKKTVKKLPSLPIPTVKRGSMRYMVKRLQRCLNYVSNVKLEVNGKMDTATCTALKRFRIRHGLSCVEVYDAKVHAEMKKLIR